MIPKSAMPPKAEPDEAAKHVLVVDDIPEICELFTALHRRIRTPAVKLTVEINSARALDLVRTNAFDVIVSDYRMREVDGLEVLKAACEHNPSGRRVLMTGYNEIPTTMDRIAAARIDAYVQKPLRYQELLVMMMEMLNNQPEALQPYRDQARDIERVGAREEVMAAGRHSAAHT